MRINELNEAWIAAGQKVSDLDNKLSLRVMSDDFKPDDEFKALKDQRDNAKAQRDAIKDQLDEARALEVKNMDTKDKKPLNDKEQSIEDKLLTSRIWLPLVRLVLVTVA